MSYLWSSYRARLYLAVEYGSAGPESNAEIIVNGTYTYRSFLPFMQASSAFLGYRIILFKLALVIAVH